MLGRGEEYANARLIWLTGGAGAGKSAIMQSIVERCAQYAVILGTFFFSRTDPSRNYAEILIPTLAYQVARAFPAAMAVLEPIIERDPLIFKASLHTQAYELLVRPLRYLIETGLVDNTTTARRVFVIDGLDECDDPQKQALIIHVVATVLCDNLSPVCFLFASRPEVAIGRAFQREPRLQSTLASITLHDDAEASSDIRQFIEDSFLDILDTHPLRNHIPSNWPERKSVDKLIWKSSGHFIYAATSMKFISSTDEHPTRALQVVEGLMPSRMGNPFAELDALYLHILSSAKYKSQVLGILRHCILTAFDNSVKAICFTHPNISPEDVALFLSDVQALVSLSPNNEAEMYILLKHASLSDFFLDANRSCAIYMSEDVCRASLLPRYFQLLDNGPQVRTSSLFSKAGGDHTLMVEIKNAIAHSQDTELLRSLICGHSLQDIWNFCLESWVHNYGPHSESRDFPIHQVSTYITSIRDSAANHDNTLYIPQFKMFIQILLDDLNKLIQTEPHYRIIPALMFSSSPSCLTFLAPLLIGRFNPLRISWGYRSYFWGLQAKGFIKGVIDPRSYEVIRRLPQSQISWGSDLAPALKLVLQHLVGYSWTPEHLRPNPHERWLCRMKPLKHMSQGCAKLSSTFYLFLRRLPAPRLPLGSGFPALERYASFSTRGRIMWHRREQCFVLLKTVVCYLHKSDCTSDIAKLARRSLPKAALWFPRLMKRARAEMDAYVRRWEESPDGLLEKAQAMSINDMD
ncbi:hypothetical protein D9619_009853 [Psilocybe cf. subviscida]|uniref:Nephrocystin 3-like N-terminal domain-containing protein n=1 Tax=Psilocybe cf. subviscida TaxID=2480587 RepID=A0A8H5F6Q2_9AGAR|nr:hypothetical protein D9619_009853 [Psilocybe cf. subviscida]